MYTRVLGLRHGLGTGFTGRLRHDEVNGELHLLDISLLARLQISKRQVGDLQNSCAIARGSFKLGLGCVLRCGHAGAKLRREEKLSVFVGRIYVSGVRPAIGFIPEMPAFDVDGIGDGVPRRSEVCQVMMLALGNVDRPAVLHRLKSENESTERTRKCIALLDEPAEGIAARFATRPRSRMR